MHDCRDAGVHIDDQLHVLRLTGTQFRDQVVKDRREHIVFVIGHCFISVQLGVIQDIADLFGDFTAGITDRDQIAVDLSVLGLIDTDTRQTDNRIHRGTDLVGDIGKKVIEPFRVLRKLDDFFLRIA